MTHNLTLPYQFLLKLTIITNILSIYPYSICINIEITTTRPFFHDTALTLSLWQFIFEPLLSITSQMNVLTPHPATKSEHPTSTSTTALSAHQFLPLYLYNYLVLPLYGFIATSTSIFFWNSNTPQHLHLPTTTTTSLDLCEKYLNNHLFFWFCMWVM